jgi:hypothetical protein
MDEIEIILAAQQSSTATTPKPGAVTPTPE